MSRSRPLEIEVQTIGDALVVSPTGLLEVATAPQLRDQLLKCMADQPGAVIVKLQNLLLAEAYTLSVFTSVARLTAGWSGVPLILVTGSYLGTISHTLTALDARCPCTAPESLKLSRCAAMSRKTRSPERRGTTSTPVTASCIAGLDWPVLMKARPPSTT